MWAVKEEQGKVSVGSLPCVTLPVQHNEAGKKTLLPAGSPQLALPRSWWQLTSQGTRGDSRELAGVGLLLVLEGSMLWPRPAAGGLLTKYITRIKHVVSEAEVCRWQPGCRLDLCKWNLGTLLPSHLVS